MMSQNRVKHGTRSQRKEPTEDLELFPLHARMQDIMTLEQVASNQSHVRRVRHMWEGTYTRINEVMMDFVRCISFDTESASRPLFVACTIYDKFLAKKDNRLKRGLVEHVGPVTWFSDDFKNVLLPFEYAIPDNYHKQFGSWNAIDYSKFLIPTLNNDTYWIEVSVHTIFTVDMCSSIAEAKTEMRRYKDGKSNMTGKAGMPVTYKLKKAISDATDESETEIAKLCDRRNNRKKAVSSSDEEDSDEEDEEDGNGGGDEGIYSPPAVRESETATNPNEVIEDDSRLFDDDEDAIAAGRSTPINASTCQCFQEMKKYMDDRFKKHDDEKKKNDATVEKITQNVDELVASTNDLKKKLDSIIQVLKPLKHDVHRLSEVIAPPDDLPTPDPVTGQVEIMGFHFPVDHVHKLKDLDDALAASLRNQAQSENEGLFYEIWKYVCQVTDHGTFKDRPNRIFNTIFKPLPLAADLLWVDRLGEVRSIRRNELYALTSISKLINHIFKVAKIGPDHVTDIHREKGWTWYFHQWRDYQTREQKNKAIWLRNKMYQTDFIWAKDPKNPTEKEVLATEYIKSTLPRAIFNTGKGDEILKKKRRSGDSQPSTSNGAPVRKKSKGTLELPALPPGLSPTELEEYQRMFPTTEDENEDDLGVDGRGNDRGNDGGSAVV